jgi:uncharacterized membrane protein
MTTGGGHNQGQPPEGEPEPGPVENRPSSGETGPVPPEDAVPPPGEHAPPQGGYHPPPSEHPQQGHYPPQTGGYPAGGYPPQAPPGYGGYTPPPPPPAGGYPPPPQGGYPTAGAPGGGWYPPPGYQQQQGYPGAAGGPGRLDPGSALRFAWSKFQANPVPWLVAVAIQLAVVVLVDLLLNRHNDHGGFGVVWNLRLGLVELILLAFNVLWTNVTGQMALSEVDGVKANFSMFTKFKNLGAFVIAGILVGVVTLVGVWGCIVPGLVIAFLGYWASWFVLDHNQNAITAIRSSINLARAYVAPLVGLAVVFILLNAVGACLAGIGLFITVPLTLIGTAWAFRTMTNGHIA